MIVIAMGPQLGANEVDTFAGRAPHPHCAHRMYRAQRQAMSMLIEPNKS
jgi:hypothetical protein